MGSKETPFWSANDKATVCYASDPREEEKTNPTEFKEYARKMGTSVEMLMSNYTQIADKEDKEEYQGIGELSSDEEEPPKKRAKKQRK